MFYNEDCITGAKKYLKNNSVDLIITDPPYGINGDKLDIHYNRNENNIIEGYIEVNNNDYAKFTNDWIAEAERVLKPGGSIYVVSGYTQLRHILNALANTKLVEKNHIIWTFNFGVYTSNKFISSHYHILYYIKPGKKPTFNTNAFYSDSEKDNLNRSLNYKDRQDVWIINKEYKPKQIKNKNELPKPLLTKMILYSSNPEDLICDFFLGSFSTAKVAIGLNREACGFELNKFAFDYQMEQLKLVKNGSLLKELRQVPENKYKKRGSKLIDNEVTLIQDEYENLKKNKLTQKQIIEILSDKYSRGYWSILNIIKKNKNI